MVIYSSSERYIRNYARSMNVEHRFWTKGSRTKNSVFSIVTLQQAFPLGVDVSPFAMGKLLSTGVVWGLHVLGIFSKTLGLNTDRVLPVSKSASASTGMPNTYTGINRPFSLWWWWGGGGGVSNLGPWCVM